MGQFVSRVRYFVSIAYKWLKRIAVMVFALVAVAACAVLTNTSSNTDRLRMVYVEGSESDAVSRVYSDILREAGYQIVSSAQNARYHARFYHEQRTNFCGGNRRVYVRARMTIGYLDMSSTERCARDGIAAHLQLQDALEDDRATYVRRLREM